ncbi:hypothetical protein [Terricaulis silvestris]|uniref:Lipoprotein n=1 Tax=Terricaulis silvestris TaxID=2686094 RepID=A0A6I6MUU6_9CAUL|nr:hypothetical protein [Terricaulis silvestris]QGZ96527.1 hypothetical protein DSM104635_03387 [Terricaulis silvestris]
MSKRCTLISTAAAFVTGACGSTQAQSLYDTLAHNGACFARIYDQAHLGSHPDQTVTHFYLGDPGPDWVETQAPAHYNLAFRFKVLDDADTYSGVAICEPQGALASCVIEGDGGSFTIERNGAGLRIRLQRMQVEGMQEFSPDLALRDNRVMLLEPALSSVCRAE